LSVFINLVRLVYICFLNPESAVAAVPFFQLIEGAIAMPLNTAFYLWVNYLYLGEPNERVHCRDTNDYTRRLVTFLLVLIIISYFYFLYCICVSSVIFCFCTLFVLDRDREDGLGGRMNRVPMVQALKSVTMKKHSEIAAEHKMDSCVICFEEYKPDDKTAIANCSEKHYFHAECLKNWMKKQQSLSALQEVA